MRKKEHTSRSATRKFTGSVVPVGSETGKILLNSKEVEKILEAVRGTSTGKTIRVDISKNTAERISALAK